MSSLCILPIEVLECITSMVATYEQMRLWQCGDRILNIKLKNGGLKRTSLYWPFSSWMPWPRWYFTTFDRLEDVEWDVTIGSSLCPTLEPNLLPKTLKRLNLVCDDVYLLLLKQNVNMNELLPLLQSLQLSGSRLSEENLKNLPSNLIELSVIARGEQIVSSTIFSDLPRSIEKLTLRLMIVDRSERENELPERLISLGIYSITSNFNWFSKLPKSLQMLSITFLNFDPDWFTLPPRLEKMDLNTATLPKSALLQLPQSLKTLELGNIADFPGEDDQVSLLPKNLTRLQLWESHFNHSGLQRLPISVTDFEANVCATHPDLISFFPPETIRVKSVTGPHSDTLNILSFPAKLQSLIIQYIDDDMCAKLPPGLRTLQAYKGRITTKGASKLPTSLTSLDAYFKMFDNNEAISYIGYISNIRLMQVDATTFSNLDENWLSSLLPSSSATASKHSCVADRSNLNENVTSLSVRSDVSEPICPYNVSESSFKALAGFKNLHTLQMEHCGLVLRDWLCFIPQNVTNLCIYPLDALPTGTQLASLPKRLRYLYLENGDGKSSKCDWNDETLQSLPRSLQDLWIYGSFPNLTHRMYDYLPPNLKGTNLRYETDSFMFRQPLDRVHG